MKHNFLIQKFNQGLVSNLGLARSDVDRINFSSVQQNNWMPRVLGSMMLRPGLRYIAPTFNNALSYSIPFIFSNDDTAIIQLTDQLMKVMVNEQYVTRPSVASAVTNNNFNSNLSGWTNADAGDAVSSWVNPGYMSLVGTLFDYAIERQQITVASGDVGVEHALRIIVARGPVTIKVGTAAGETNYIGATVLSTGTHSLTFTPIGNFWIDLSSNSQAAALVDSCTIESAGDMQIPAPWLEADLGKVRYEQSADVVYALCDGYPQYKILRYSPDSWSVVKYEGMDGPFLPLNVGPITLTPSAIVGDITLTASQDFFNPGNVGSLFRLTSVGQEVLIAADGDGQWSNPIKVTGIGATQRGFNISISGTWAATIKLQMSAAEPGSWLDVAGQSWTGNTTTTYADGLDNQIIYYRIGIDTGDYTSGTADLELSYASDDIIGIVRVTGYTSTTSVSAAVLTPLGATTATQNWEEGEWSTRRGFPSACALYEGRLFQAGRAKLWASVSDAYESYDDDSTLGDSATIVRTIGQGPVDVINWLKASQRMIAGAQGAEWAARSSSLDEILTPSNCNLKDPTTQGSAPIDAIKMDNTILFVQKSGIRLFQTNYNLEADDYTANDLSSLVPELMESGIVRLALQRQPDTRLHVVMKNGRVAILVFDPIENVKCWITASTAGFVEDAFVLPGTTEDAVYYQVRRIINGATVRYIERWAYESECAGGTMEYDDVSTSVISVIVDDEIIFEDGTWLTLRDVDGNKIGNNLQVIDGAIALAAPTEYATLTPSLYKLADCFTVYDGVAATTISVPQLEAAQVVVWADGIDAGVYTVSGGNITLAVAAEKVMVGLAYTAKYKSVKLSITTRGIGSYYKQSILEQPKTINAVGIVLKDTHAQGIKYGSDFEHLDDMPQVEDAALVDPNYIWPEYDKEYFEMDSTFDTDSRICLEAASPRPCTVLAAILGEKVNEQNRTGGQM